MTPSSVSPDPAVETRGLRVERGGTTVFEDLTLAVPAGEALLVRGANGAGKTTLLLTLYGAIRPMAGVLAVRGADPDIPRQALTHLVGHRAAVKPRLTVAENLGFWAAFNGGPGDTVLQALDRVGLGRLGAVAAGHLSAGQVRRLALARLLVSWRPVWLLDEPTAALDTAGASLVVGMIDSHCASGGTVVAATHLDLELTAPASTVTLGGTP